jgi:hypothetical protein
MCSSDLLPASAFGYGYILKHFIPRLKRHGVDQAAMMHAGRQSGQCSRGTERPRLTTEFKCQERFACGESWVSTATMGFDQFPTVTYHTGADELLKALKATDFDVTFMRSA